jgi:hypothetical protein
MRVSEDPTRPQSVFASLLHESGTRNIIITLYADNLGGEVASASPRRNPPQAYLQHRNVSAGSGNDMDD